MLLSREATWKVLGPNPLEVRFTLKNWNLRDSPKVSGIPKMEWVGHFGGVGKLPLHIPYPHTAFFKLRIFSILGTSKCLVNFFRQHIFQLHPDGPGPLVQNPPEKTHFFPSWKRCVDPPFNGKEGSSSNPQFSGGYMLVSGRCSYFNWMMGLVKSFSRMDPNARKEVTFFVPSIWSNHAEV